jgi:hypothetical protein
MLGSEVFLFSRHGQYRERNNGNTKRNQEELWEARRVGIYSPSVNRVCARNT